MVVKGQFMEKKMETTMRDCLDYCHPLGPRDMDLGFIGLGFGFRV